MFSDVVFVCSSAIFKGPNVYAFWRCPGYAWKTGSGFKEDLTPKELASLLSGTITSLQKQDFLRK